MNAPIGTTVTVPSRSGGPAHHVSFVRSIRDGAAGPAGTVYVTCDCGAGRNFWANLARGKSVPCWAMRSLAGAYGVRIPVRDARRHPAPVWR